MSDQCTLAPPAKAAEDLTYWKTHAWIDPGTVTWYSGRMIENESTNHMKNVLEIGILKRFARGPDIVDIGTGTGRAALPLIAAGYSLTGIDSSQAMLDEVRRLAGQTPIVLKAGDLFRLPCEDRSFDCAVALNVLVHFPTWRESLSEWKRVVRHGGRIIFDIHSLDHVTAAYGDDKQRWPEALRRTDDPKNFSQFMSRLSIDELVSFANDADLSISAVVPYGAFLGGGNTNWLHYEALESTHKWTRLLSWFARDERLMELGLFLEETLISRLTTRLAGRMFVVLDNKKDTAANARFAAEMKLRDRALDQIDMAALRPWLPMTIEEFSAELDRLLRPLRNRHFFFLLFRSLISHCPTFNFRGALSTTTSRQMAAWMDCERIDRQAVEIARTWSTKSSFKFHSGVDVTLGMEYFLVRDLLTKYFGMFGGHPK
ncbi:MAG TPA: class I SAM-dependent methyltransferase [Steroidobacteraceae bacterium]|nr:class I SAM-dependent methyltransferase [Steroidobacteraceae bacterium]